MSEHRIIQGDVMDGLRTLPDGCVQCTVTSPPYFALRDYRVDGQIGLEETPEQFIQKMVGVFHEVKRVTRPDGVLFLNLGDSYSGSMSTKGAVVNKNSMSAGTGQDVGYRDKPLGIVNGYKAKDLMGIPWRVALALQQPYVVPTCVKSEVDRAKHEHPTQKPLALIKWILEKYSDEGMTVLDPFMGSGTTCVACKKLGRNYIGIEKEPVYVAIAKKRLEKVNNHKIEEWF
jgi:DNA modification methylase